MTDNLFHESDWDFIKPPANLLAMTRLIEVFASKGTALAHKTQNHIATLTIADPAGPWPTPPSYVLLQVGIDPATSLPSWARIALSIMDIYNSDFAPIPYLADNLACWEDLDGWMAVTYAQLFDQIRPATPQGYLDKLGRYFWTCKCTSRIVSRDSIPSSPHLLLGFRLEANDPLYTYTVTSPQRTGGAWEWKCRPRQQPMPPDTFLLGADRQGACPTCEAAMYAATHPDYKPPMQEQMPRGMLIDPDWEGDD